MAAPDAPTLLAKWKKHGYLILRMPDAFTQCVDECAVSLDEYFGADNVKERVEGVFFGTTSYERS